MICVVQFLPLHCSGVAVDDMCPTYVHISFTEGRRGSSYISLLCICMTQITVESPLVPPEITLFLKGLF